MKKLFKWIFFLNKRLFKKASFTVILLFMLLSVTAFGAASRNESGFLTVMLVNTDKNDGVSSSVVKALLKERSMILFKEASSPDNAVDAVKSGRADSAWIFGENIGQKIYDFSSGKSADKMVTVVEREQNVLLRLSHEKLTAKLYRYASKNYYISFVRKNVDSLSIFSDDELGEFFDQTEITDRLFVYGSLKGSDGESTDYLTYPLRGLLGLIITLCGMAGALYYMQDKQSRTYDFFAENRKIILKFANITVPVIIVAFVALACLVVTGLSVGIFKEIACSAVFALACVSFCALISAFFQKINLFATVIPIITVAMIGVCPIFFNLRITKPFSYIFPVTYYLNSVYDARYLVYAACYSVICFLLTLMLHKKCR